MSILRTELADISEADIDELIANAESEGLQLDLKRDMYGNADADRKEYLKDISSFANSSGGHLLIGVDEQNGSASAKSPIAGDPDQVLQRLENMARTSIEPRIVGLRMRAVPCAAGGNIFVIRVPASWNPPHRVSLQNSNRFFLRSSAGAHEASVEELRAMFANAAGIHEKIRRYVSDRVHQIGINSGVVPLSRDEGA
jgi:predicted HTH transcriptional regulator